MRLAIPFPFRLSLAALALAGNGWAADSTSFDAARKVLESKCLSCHCPEKTKGELLMTTREQFLKGGEGGAAIQLEKPAESEVLKRIKLDEDDDDVMPPKDGPLKSEEIAAIEAWLTAGAPWPEGVVMAPRAKTALPDWDAPADPAIGAIEPFPKTVTLETAADFHKVLVMARFKDAATQDVTRQVKASIADPSVAKLEGTLLKPLKDGSTTLNLEYRGLKAEVAVIVKDANKPRPVSFQLDVMPVLTSSGCNTGSCHGSARGKDGFHLSLFGFDPQGDHFRLTRENPGRRVNLALPEESLMITKSTGGVPHTGGKLFEKGSAPYETLVAWIRDGAEYDQGEIAKPTGVTIEPPQVVLKGEGLETPYTVRATYSDGTDRDVTTLSSFSTSNDNSVSVNKRSGLATSKNRGEAFLLGRFMTFTEVSQSIVIPKESNYTRPELPEFNYIDKLVYDKLHKLRIIPAPLCDDETFLRRVFIDVVGKLPEPSEREQFLTSTDPKKREQLVDELIARKEFSEMWVMKWAELLQIRTFNNGGQQVSYKAALGYYNWLRDRIASNMPFNQVVKEILSSEGGTFSSPPTNFFQIEQDTLKLTENVAQVFMGTRIQCAQCHNHPFDRWTMDDYYGFASFFAQVKRKPAEDPRERIVFDGGGEVNHLVTKQPVKPRFLGAKTPDDFGKKTRREAVAEWLSSNDNPWFARNVSNIVWSHFFGVGITDPVDDMRISNPPSNPELLAALSSKFVEYNYDVRKLVRDICTSRTYQLSSAVNETNETDSRNFSRSLVRRVRAEVLLDCISQVTQTPNKFKGLPLGSRAVQIADGNTSNYFLTTFGRATRATVCSCEVKMEPNLSQALHLLNGDATHNRIQQGKVVQALAEQKKSPEEIIKLLYLKTLNRDPVPEEQTKLMEAVNEGKDDKEKQAILNDVFWALLNSKEFIFNH
ncbi:PSD1 and planctomycete cytochrome C domain-containing protein [Haloferula sp. BvORR071]|uniref:PSD1 and planctomycete cytochrome C domain-containing protein n=1 Tax=Haloferula sp. BvORR071 TaxID=1396141 RepID=UPI0009464DF7|nr:PSD1 and planctomycete cytochrome C domain-containing protein [Haloferula sp. BvORR071]